MARATNDFFSRPSNPAFNPDLVAKYAPPLDTPATLGRRHADPRRVGTPESNREAHALLTGWARAGEWTEAVTFCRSWIGCSAYWRDGEDKGRSLRPGRAFHSGAAWGNRSVPVDPDILAAEREVALWRLLRPRLRLRWWSDSVCSLDDVPPDDCRAYVLRIIYGGMALESASTRAAQSDYSGVRGGPGSVELTDANSGHEALRRRAGLDVVVPVPKVIPLAQPLLDAFLGRWNEDRGGTLADVARELWPDDARRRYEATRHVRNAYRKVLTVRRGGKLPAVGRPCGSECPARMRPMGVPYKVRLWFDSTDPMPFLRWTVGKPMERVVPGAPGRELGAPRRKHIAAFAARLGIPEADVRAWIAGDPEPEYDRQLSEERERSAARLARAIESYPERLAQRVSGTDAA